MNIEQSHPLWSETQTARAFVEFLQHNFEHRGTEFYIHDIRDNLERYEYRQYNPLYLPFASRILLIAAEHHMPGIVGHISNHSNHHWKCDFMAPPYLLALGVYLSKSAVYIAERKAGMFDLWNDADISLLKEHVPQLMDAWAKPWEIESFPTTYVNGRKDCNKPVYIPDTAFLKQVASIPFWGPTAVFMRPETFETSIVPTVAKIFFPYKDPSLVADVFLNDPANWVR